jgi:hypothetical protein
MRARRRPVIITATGISISVALLSAACGGDDSADPDADTDSDTDTATDTDTDADTDTDTGTETETDTDSCEPHLEDFACVVDDIECKCLESPLWCEGKTHDAMLAWIDTWGDEGGACMFWCADGHSYYHSYYTDEPALDYHFDGSTGEISGYLYSTDSAAFDCDDTSSSTEIFGQTECALDCLIAATDLATCAGSAVACETDGGVDGGE